jgi:hypothetical protein
MWSIIFNPKMDFHDAPKMDIWTFAKDGTFNISGRGYGYVATKENYRDYHLVIEFKWGTKTWGAREKKAKDNGILLHAYGPHGAYSDTWMASIEAQIIEGGVGDILVLSPTPTNSRPRSPPSSRSTATRKKSGKQALHAKP